MKKSTKGPLPKKLTAPKQPISKRDTVNLAKALTSPKALAAQRIAAAVRPRPMGLKTQEAPKFKNTLVRDGIPIKRF
jgi:hypothetical protein